MRIVFFGSGAFGLPTLQALAEEHTLTGIVTQPDKPAGRGGKMTPTPVGEWAAGHAARVPIFKPENVNETGMVERIRGLPAEAWVVIAFGQKLKPALLHDRFAINLHASLLPRWRGAAPINAAVLAGDVVTGNSVITLADRMDAGMVLGQSHRAIDPRQTAGELHDQLAQDGAGLVRRVLHEFATGTLHPEPQDEAMVTLAKKMSKADGNVDFTRTAEECRRRVHALTPWPGVTVRFRGEGLRVLRAAVVTEEDALTAEERESVAGHRSRWAEPAAAGTILPGCVGAGIVACGGRSCLHLLEVQAAGKRAMAWRDFANGRGVRSEEVIEGGPIAC